MLFRSGSQAEPTGEGEDVFPLVGGRPQFTTGAGTFNAPRDGGRRIHHAQDIGVDPNTPVVAMRSGTVIDAYSSGYGAAGGAVVVKYDNGQQGLYGQFGCPLGQFPFFILTIVPLFEAFLTCCHEAIIIMLITITPFNLLATVRNSTVRHYFQFY